MHYNHEWLAKVLAGHKIAHLKNLQNVSQAKK